MAFSINTNIASLQAMNYLTNNQRFQNKTIAEVTSGLRIVNSGDDAAGLAVANQFAAQVAVLNQGIQNANDGLATLQTIDGGISNISQLLNRASTLAGEAASGTFQGSRTVLNNEFQSVLAEINRQAQSIGMNTGGAFNKALSVFIGGGRDITGNPNNAAAVAEGVVSVNLAGAAVDAQGLGLTSFQANGATSTNGTAVLEAVTKATNLSTSGGTLGRAGEFQLSFSGAGFSDANAITVTANVGTATSLSDIANAINAGIANVEAANSASANVQALTAAGIQAQVNPAGTGIIFTSASAPFSVTDLGGTDANTGKDAAIALLGSGATGNVVDAGGQNVQLTVTTALDSTNSDVQDLTFSAVGSNGALATTTIHLDSTTNSGSTAAAIAYINQQLQAQSVGSPLKNIVAEPSSSADGTINFLSTGSFQIYVGAGTGGDGFLSGGAQSTMATSAQSGTSGGLDLTTSANAGLAVTAIGNAVANLGNAQAAVGKGENTLAYATNLAQSQATNEATSESGLRDANMAVEAANLTKAQILLQAGVAALAQANAAPQNILALLKV